MAINPVFESIKLNKKQAELKEQVKVLSNLSLFSIYRSTETPKKKFLGSLDSYSESAVIYVRAHNAHIDSLYYNIRKAKNLLINTIFLNILN